MAAEGILLESGTDEVEILEFNLGGQIFGVNVLKIQSIEQYDEAKLTLLPRAPAAVPGTFLFRNHTIPMINLNIELELEQSETDESVSELHQNRVVLVTQYNSMMAAFLVDGVRGIERVRWQDMKPMADLLTTGDRSAFTGTVSIDGHETLIIDMENISDKHFPAQALLDITSEEFSHPRQNERSNVKIVFVEDSRTVQHMICNVLSKGNYTQVTTFENGELAYNALRKMIEKADAEGEDITKYVDLIVTDIEMPQMDGLTLCHHIKHRHGKTQLPVVLYSSLLREQMLNKCKDVKADAYIPKPDCARLVGMVDSICLDKKITGMPYSVE
jgi:two-component system, chemotaxis family, chemotaxis protein CheV